MEYLRVCEVKCLEGRSCSFWLLNTCMRWKLYVDPSVNIKLEKVSNKFSFIH